MSSTLLYISHCPICEQGLVRVRIHASENSITPFFICDECEAAWSDSELQLRISRYQPSARRDLAQRQRNETQEDSLEASSVSKNWQSDFFDDDTHWATAPEIALLGLGRKVKKAREKD